jgi:DNA-binding protein H-NS
MKTNVRPFVREYKSRSFKTTLQTLEWSSVSRSDAETREHLAIASRRNDEVLKDAEAAFRQGVTSPSESAGDGRNGSLSTRRVLPCLLEQPTSATSDDVGETSDTRRKSLSTTTRRVKARLKVSRGIHSTLSSNVPQSALWRQSVIDEFVKLTDLEVLSLIERAKIELARRKEADKEKLRAEIEAKLKNAGLDLGDLFKSERKSASGGKSKDNDGQSSVAPKYKNHVSGETWSGRGRAPKWVTTILQQREWTVEEFKQSDEFLIA